MKKLDTLPCRAMSQMESFRRRGLAVNRRLWFVVAGGATTAASLALRKAVAAGAGPAATEMADAELKRAELRGELCSAANATGTGLRGEYFAGGLGQGLPLLVRVDATIDFDRSLEWPADKAKQRPGSVRWTGWVKPPTSGRYRFHVDQPSARVLVSRHALVGEGTDGNAAIELAAGRFYPITLEVNRLEGMVGRLRLEWTAPHGARFLIPRALLFIPNESALTTARP